MNQKYVCGGLVTGKLTEKQLRQLVDCTRWVTESVIPKSKLPKFDFLKIVRETPIDIEKLSLLKKRE